MFISIVYDLHQVVLNLDDDFNFQANKYCILCIVTLVLT